MMKSLGCSNIVAICIWEFMHKTMPEKIYNFYFRAVQSNCQILIFILVLKWTKSKTVEFTKNNPKNESSVRDFETLTFVNATCITFSILPQQYRGLVFWQVSLDDFRGQFFVIVSISSYFIVSCVHVDFLVTTYSFHILVVFLSNISFNLISKYQCQFYLSIIML